MGHLVLEKIPHLKDEIGNMSKGYPLYQLYNIYCIARLLSMSIKLLSIQEVQIMSLLFFKSSK